MQRRLTRTGRLLALLITGTVLLAGCGAGTSTDGTTLDPAAFANLTDSPDVVVLDVRTPEEFADGHLPDAVNLDLQDPAFTGKVAALDPDAEYAVYCRSGNRSATAMAIMRDAGIDSVAHLGGGIVAWADAGGEIVGGP